MEDALEAALEAAARGDVGFSSDGEWGSSSSGDAGRVRGAGGSDSEPADLERGEDGVDIVALEEWQAMRARGSGGRSGGGKVPNSTAMNGRGKPLPASADDRAEVVADKDAAPDSFSQVQCSYCMHACCS